jgi:hypothetical protein
MITEVNDQTISLAVVLPADIYNEVGISIVINVIFTDNWALVNSVSIKYVIRSITHPTKPHTCKPDYGIA